MRKITVIPMQTLASRVSDFEQSLDEFSSDIALAYNMNQKSTRMPKEKLAERMQKHKDRIKERKDKIKAMEIKKKSISDPEKVRLISQRITKQGELIAKHNEAIKYYKMLSSIKPPKLKVNPKTKVPAKGTKSGVTK